MFALFVLVLAVLVGSWYGFASWAKKKNHSDIFAQGGGFIVGCIAMSVAILIVVPSSVLTGISEILATTPVLKKSPEQTAIEQRLKRIESGFSVWDGSHRGLERVIKQAMNDPDSYQHVETKYWDMKDHLVVLTTYRGKNSFGGVVKEWIKAKCDLDGNVTEIIETSNDFCHQARAPSQCSREPS